MDRPVTTMSSVPAYRARVQASAMGDSATALAESASAREDNFVNLLKVMLLFSSRLLAPIRRLAVADGEGIAKFV